MAEKGQELVSESHPGLFIRFGRFGYSSITNPLPTRNFTISAKYLQLRDYFLAKLEAAQLSDAAPRNAHRAGPCCS
jgi:hypothetical protein